MSEAAFKKTVHNKFIVRANSLDKELHWQLHEDSLSVGIPDISYGLCGVNGWIEAKWSKELPTGIYNPKFRPYQEPWLIARGRSGGNTHLVHGFEDGFIIMDHAALSKRRRDMTLKDITKLTGAYVMFGEFDVDAVRILLYK